MSKLFSSAEAASYLKLTVRTVRRYAKSGTLPATKLPGHTGSYVFTEDDLQAFRDGETVPEEEPVAS